MGNISLKHVLSVFGLMAAALTARVLPHPPNVTPMTAICILSGMALGYRVLAFALPILVVYATDFVLNNTLSKIFITADSGIVWWSDFMTYTFGAYILIIGLSAFLLKKQSNLRVASTAVIAGLLFFAITNFGSWLSFDFYPKTFAGLLLSFEAGLPFLRFSLLGDIVFALALYNAYTWVVKPSIQLEMEAVKAK